MPSFLNAIFLAGLAGAALPVIIHLLNREKSRKVDFGWFRFLARAQAAHARRFRIREVLLLVMRTLLCILLALAFARPFFADADARETREGAPSHIAIVLDLSYSMRFPGWWEKARARALDIVASTAIGDRITVISAADRALTVQPFTDDVGAIRQVINQELAPTCETTDLGSAFRAAEDRLRRVGAGDARLYVISDHQEAGWKRLDPGDRAGPGVEVFLEEIAGPERENLALTQVRATPDEADSSLVSIDARIRNFGLLDRPNLSVSLFMSGERTATRTISVPAGEATEVAFSTSIHGPGARSGWVEVHDDLLEIDNRRYFVAAPPNRSRVLCVDGSGSRHRASYYLLRALSPWPDSRRGGPSPRVIPPEALDATAVEQTDVIFICGPARLSGPAAQVLEEFVGRGGGLLAAGGERGLPQLGKLMPGLAPRVHWVPEEEGFAILTDLDFQHPLFSAFRAARHGDFGAAHTFAYARLDPPGDARILMRFDDGTPALVERDFGSGKILLFTSSLDTSWTDLPKRPVFAPLVHEILHYLTASGTLDGNREYLVGDRLGENGELACEPGIHTIRIGPGSRLVPVNVDCRESDLRSADMTLLQERLRPVEEATGAATWDPVVERNERMNEDLEYQQQWWWWLMLGALILAVGEMTLANLGTVS